MDKIKQIRKILIANRGEIAVRIIRACNMLGISTVAVYSDIDKNAMHVRLADQAYLLGPANAEESYLSAEKIIKIALLAKVDAIHPGYGFLSENADFAKIVTDNDLIFIGPTYDTIASMGDKAVARALMIGENIPVVPGFQPANKDENVNWENEAERIGYPLLVKAVAGGGGKGMRVVAKQKNLLDEIASAQREAKNALGDQRIYLEKLIENARHIEFQILADQYGNIIHLGERECSIQRRHQKIIEETPSPFLDDKLREIMGDVAIGVAKKVAYVNAGTVEFIVDTTTKQFYFLEMNTRLQVEHPITELVTGIDLVAWQIKIAAGHLLDISQNEVIPRGHAIEARIYAENPANQFLPEIGKIQSFSIPSGLNFRLDSGVETGDQVSIYYDPLLAKISVLANNRDEAINNIVQGIKQSKIFGVITNLRFLIDVIESKEFLKGLTNTKFIEDKFSDWQRKELNDEITSEILISAILLDYVSQDIPTNNSVNNSENDYSPWDKLGNFRLGEKQ